jgi:hypothetical protein
MHIVLAIIANIKVGSFSDLSNSVLSSIYVTDGSRFRQRKGWNIEEFNDIWYNKILGCATIY